ncbi:nitroreductase family protein [Cohnella nanjingensis]|uniref:Nitroreductase family protein n=1 Tax=Cohnella nanjingensis TaxID=1387779 RepID=A0A7X0RNY9_9BACL|nr:nitroreductase family protein [Cohnella nanjingensis]MBB6669841.1 nitroreductase family protein [Cohnella nanjingensis]
MSAIPLDTIQDYKTVVRERHSVRHYDPNWQISQAELMEILGEAALAPSSSNTQSWRFFVFHDKALKQRLLPIANNQQQVADASATVAVLGDIEGYKRAGQINGIGVDKGYMTPEFAEQFTANTLKGYGGLPPEVLTRISLVDGGLVSMQLMLSAKARGYDTVPMGGFNAAKLVEEFGIPSNLVPVMLIAIGRAAVPGRLTPRLPVEEVTFWNGEGLK